MLEMACQIGRIVMSQECAERRRSLDEALEWKLLYSFFSHNFVLTLLEIMKMHEITNVMDMQIRSNLKMI